MSESNDLKGLSSYRTSIIDIKETMENNMAMQHNATIMASNDSCLDDSMMQRNSARHNTSVKMNDNPENQDYFDGNDSFYSERKTQTQED